jgi:very-short-patch-repair endonuclease
MKSDDIKPIQTSSEGVYVFKRYLEYAEGKGKVSIDGVGGEPDSDFEVEVADRLRLRRFEVEMQVGVSGFKIDLGVRHPDHPEKFLVGIECDGAAYHSSKSARDRDRLREEILRGLGWEILRVWSTDWFDNPNFQTERLVRQIEELRTRPVPPYEDYIVSPVYASATVEPEYIDKVTAREVSTGITNGDGLADSPVSPQNGNDVGPSTDWPFVRSSSLSESDVFEVLRQFRDTVIAREIENWEPQRSILRESMIETLVIQRVRDPDDWFRKVPQFQRAGTNALEKQRYLDQICEIIDRIGGDDGDNPRPNGAPSQNLFGSSSSDRHSLQ